MARWILRSQLPARSFAFSKVCPSVPSIKPLSISSAEPSATGGRPQVVRILPSPPFRTVYRVIVYLFHLTIGNQRIPAGASKCRLAHGLYKPSIKWCKLCPSVTVSLSWASLRAFRQSKQTPVIRTSSLLEGANGLGWRHCQNVAGRMVWKSGCRCRCYPDDEVRCSRHGRDLVLSAVAYIKIRIA